MMGNILAAALAVVIVVPQLITGAGKRLPFTRRRPRPAVVAVYLTVVFVLVVLWTLSFAAPSADVMLR